MTDRTSTARPGFHKALFGHDPSQVDAAIQELTARLEAAERDAQSARGRIRQLEEAPAAPAAPNFGDLGGRLAAILSLAEEEATFQRDEATAAAQTSQAETDRYAQRVRSAADEEAAQVVEEARRQARDVIDDAEREAAALRAEAQALVESHRARSAAAAADLERSLAARRDQAASDFAAQLAVHETSLHEAEARAAQLAEQSESAFSESRAMASEHITQAEQQAALILQRARAQADRVTRNSEREVAAASAHRDSINAQLDVLRQMLATLGSAGEATPDGAEKSAEPRGPELPDAAGRTADGTDGERTEADRDRGEEIESARSLDPQPAEPLWYETLHPEEGSAPAARAVEGASAAAESPRATGVEHVSGQRSGVAAQRRRQRGRQA